MSTSSTGSFYDVNVDDDNNLIDSNGQIIHISQAYGSITTSATSNAVLTSGGWNGQLIYGSGGTGTTTEETRAINLDKIAEMDETKRTVVMGIIAEYNKGNWDTKKIFENTLEAYGIFENKDSLTRKNKIGDVLK